MWDLVILDEFISLVDHASICHKSIQLLENAIKRGKTVIVCDALLPRSWMDVIKQMTPLKAIEIVNDYKPDQDKPM